MGDASGKGEDHFDLVAPGLARGLPTFCDKRLVEQLQVQKRFSILPASTMLR